MHDVFLKLKDVSVRYEVRESIFQKLKSILKSGSVGITGIDSLKKINFELQSGDSLGLIGQNGAGKTTLLKTMAEIYQPISGEVLSSGRTASLIDISMGFNPHDTGLDNVSRKLLFMGLNKQEIKGVLPEIIEFSELENYIELPLSTYSSGMRMRLAFATATSINPEILLMDEWISTGDKAFLSKIRRRLETYVEQSDIVVFASHSSNLLRNVCNKGLVLDDGELVFFGEIEEALAYYDSEVIGDKNQNEVKSANDFLLERAIFFLKRGRSMKPTNGMTPEESIVKAHKIINKCMREMNLK